jgi:putative membrane protein
MFFAFYSSEFWKVYAQMCYITLKKLGKKMKYHVTLLIIFSAVLVWSGINPHDYFTWFLEIFPAIIGLLVLALTCKKFKLTNLLYTLILVHCIILMVGGHYTYAEVPLFDWLREAFGQARNNYDKVGHFAQGFIPAMITREILLRHKVVNGRAWLNVFIVTMSMAISVSYEFIEWFVAELSGESAESFLGTQGYIWDTQSDMLYATIGAIMALILLSKIHDRLLQKVLKT